MSVAFAPTEQRLVLSNVDWPTYEKLLHDLDGRHLRLNYDRGRLEIMTVGSEHESIKKLLARLLETMTEVLNIPIRGLGNTTFRREDAERGLEPDECWYIEHEAQMRDRKSIDLLIDPPPDLVIEVEVSRSVVDRLGIFAALGVSEVWRCDGLTLTILALTAAGTYVQSDQSPTFPDIPIAGIVEHLNRRGQTDETSIVRSFRAWVSEIVGER